MKRTPSDTENKLLLLHAIDRLGAVTAEQLLVFVVENDHMGYISLQLGLAELADAGLIRKRPHPLGTLYVLTGKGRDSLSLFEKRIPYSRLTSVQEQATDWRQRFKLEKQMPASFEKTEGGEYTVRLRLIEHDADLIDLRISVPTHEQAQQFCDAWIKQASSIYATIVRSLGEDE